MEIISSMSGSVFKVNVAIGDNIDDGQEIIILESMKMEIPVATNKGGIVKEIKVTEGDFVQEGQVIAVLK